MPHANREAHNAYMREYERRRMQDPAYRARRAAYEQSRRERKNAAARAKRAALRPAPPPPPPSEKWIPQPVSVWEPGLDGDRRRFE